MLLICRQSAVNKLNGFCDRQGCHQFCAQVQRCRSASLSSGFRRLRLINIDIILILDEGKAMEKEQGGE
jgi:hypothetical protein